MCLMSSLDFLDAWFRCGFHLQESPVTSPNEYFLASIETASPYQLHKMVVDAAVRNARFAVEQWNTADFDDVLEALAKARACVAELMNGVREEAAPDLASRQQALFAFCYKQLVMADVERSPDHAANGLRILMIHQETWQLLGEKLAAANAAGIPQPNHLRVNRSNSQQPTGRHTFDQGDELPGSGFSMWT